jgi:hypothetical protein
MAENVYYHATLALNAPLILKENKKQGGINVFVQLGDKPFLLLTKRRLAAMLEENPPEGEQTLILWPRTDKEGLLGSGTQLAIYKPVGKIDREPNVLRAVGELVKIDRENGLLQIQIHQNEKQGNLRKPFKIPLVASLEVLEGLPELGSGLEVWAELKPRTGRVVITRVQTVLLPPKRVTDAEPTDKQQVGQN